MKVTDICLHHPQILPIESGARSYRFVIPGNYFREVADTVTDLKWFGISLVIFSELGGIVSCDSAAIRIRIRILRCQRPTKRQNTNLAKQSPVFVLPTFPVGAQESGPKQGQLHAAILVTSIRCDSCAQGALPRRMVSRRNFCDAESLAKRYGETFHSAVKQRGRENKGPPDIAPNPSPKKGQFQNGALSLS